MRGEFIDVGGVRLYYYASGRSSDEPPVVLLHGFPTSSHLWQDVAPLLAPRRRVVVLDLLGHGRSDRPGPHPVTIRGHADRLVTLLDALQVGRACLVGHDVGGAIAQLVAVRCPTRVSHLGLISSVGYDQWPPRELRLARAMLPLTRQLPSGWLLALLRTDLHRGFADPEQAARSTELYLRPFGGAEGREVLLAHLMQLDPADTMALAPRLGEIAVPTLVAWSEADPFVPATVGRRLAADIPHADAHALVGPCHYAPEEAPEQVADLILSLLDR